MEFKSWNPTFKENLYSPIEWYTWEVMTMQGTVNKTYILLAITILSALWIWYYLSVLWINYLFLALVLGWIVSFVLAIIISFAPKVSPYLAPFYAIFEWVFLWAISLKYEIALPWIVVQTLCLTFAIFLWMLLAYQIWFIKATEKFKLWVIAATFWIFVLYIINFILSITWLYTMPFIHEGWIIWIWFSLVVVVLASLNLVLDFDFIESSVKNNLPKYMEWFSSFALIVTLAWLYIEILRLLSKLRSE